MTLPNLSITTHKIQERMIQVLRQYFGTMLTLVLVGCNHTDNQTKNSTLLFSESPPQSQNFLDEIQYLEKTGKIQRSEIEFIENQLLVAEKEFGIPRALLWCILFQESRFDSFKNALVELPAKGLGQFTPFALIEVNDDTDQYFVKTSEILSSQVSPQLFPITFDLKLPKKKKIQQLRKVQFPSQAPNSYFRTETAVFASAAYLNNRYHQLKRALDHQRIPYDPQVLWLYAAAAYNKGSRSIFLLLTNEYMTIGEKALSELLHSTEASYQLLTHTKRLDYSLSKVWKKETRTRYIDELVRNMKMIASCSLKETKQ